jgi:hypothetical protein
MKSFLLFLRLAIHKQPSERAMKMADEVYNHFIKFPVKRWDDHAEAIQAVATIIDRHTAAKPDGWNIEQWRDLFNDAINTLCLLRDNQNGCPLPKYEKEWTRAMTQANRILEHPMARQALADLDNK